MTLSKTINQPGKILIKGGHIVDPAREFAGTGDLLLEDGKIKACGTVFADETVQVIDASGKYVVPGLIDIHVHLREPGFEAKETIATGTRSAAMGGFTAVACMPNTNPVIDSRALVESIKAKAVFEGAVRVYPIGAITKGSLGEQIAEIGDMSEAGAVAISDDGRPVMNGQVMRHAMDYAKMFNLTVIAHSEDKNLVNDGVMNEGYLSTVLGLRGIPAAAEEAMIARDILLAELTGCRLHIAHVSTKGSVELVRMAKKRGLPVTAEATPHHFTLTDEAVVGYNTNTKVNPPLRSKTDVEAIKKGLADGTIEIIATDHAPHTGEEKAVEYNYAPFGMIGLETAVTLVMQELVEPGVLTLEQAIAKMTVNPARLLGLPGGTLTQGSPADITIIDPNMTLIYERQMIQSRACNTPFLGHTFTGWPVATIVGGRVVMQDRKIII